MRVQPEREGTEMASEQQYVDVAGLSAAELAEAIEVAGDVVSGLYDEGMSTAAAQAWMDELLAEYDRRSGAE